MTIIIVVMHYTIVIQICQVALKKSEDKARFDKGEDGAAWYREYERLPSQNGD